MRILYSGTPNPKMVTLTEYVEKAMREEGYEVVFFNNRDYRIPGRLRGRINLLEKLDIARINRSLIELTRNLRPDIFLETGGMRILPDTIKKIRAMGVTTVLWTIDPPRDLFDFLPIMEAAPQYDFVFTGGMEAYDVLKSIGVPRLSWLPFACDPDFHKPIKLTQEEIHEFGYDVVFIGSIHQNLYLNRVEMLSGLVGHNLGVWGPGGEDVPDDSPLKPCIKGSNAPYDIWTKVYSASKIVLSQHYRPSAGFIPCHQASPRVYEILACGGFQVVDNQVDVLRLFNDRDQLVVFKDKNQLAEIIRYYLSHEDERLIIASRGLEAVLKSHTYRHRIKEMMNVIQ